MKRINKLVAVVLSVFALVIMTTLIVCAEDEQSVGLMTNQIASQSTQKMPEISHGIDVIASRSGMAIAGIKGDALNFSADRFACAMNLSKFDYITITKLPDISCGALYIGSEGVSVGQRIKTSEIIRMTYEECESGYGSTTTFDFKINDNAYDITCTIYMIDKINYSPTISLASYASLNNQTYKNMKFEGLLSAYDPEGDEITFEIVTRPSNGIVILDDCSLGKYTYIPNSSYVGNDSFKYVAYDKYGNYSTCAEVKLTIASPSISTVYSDLLNDGVHCYAIAATESGLMNGIQVGDYYYFEADREVTRAEFLVTAMKAIGIKNVPACSDTGFFDDSDINPEMKGYIALAYSKEYISGTKRAGNIYFYPDEKIKLSEAAVILSNMIGYAQSKITPVFADDIPSWSGKAIESLYTLGIIEAPDMVTGAEENVTRGDMAKLLNKTMFVLNN